MRTTLLTSLLFATAFVKAQNLVINPSFETNKPEAVVVACEFSQFSYDFPRRAEAWRGFRDGTPDLLRAAENCDWLKQVHSGEQCLGLITYLPAGDVGQKVDFHEYVQGQLSAPLKPGQKARFRPLPAPPGWSASRRECSTEQLMPFTSRCSRSSPSTRRRGL